MESWSETGRWSAQVSGGGIRERLRLPSLVPSELVVCTFLFRDK